MPQISKANIRAYVNALTNSTTTVEQGRALENMICYVFKKVPGITISRRNELNVFRTEEIDVALWNDGHRSGFFYLPNIILVECKNWSQPVSSIEISWFDTKLRSRGLDFGVLIAATGITGDADALTAAHSVVASALREGRRLVVITNEDLLALCNTDDLVHLVKEKLCDLTVLGTVA